MAVYRQVHVSFWQDPKVIEEMTPEDKYFYLYLLTNPSTTQIGVYSITKKQMAFDMGYSIESINCLLERFQTYHKVIRYNKETREIALLNWGRYNFNRGGKPVEDCVKKELKQVKDKSLLELVMQKIENERIKKLFTDALNDSSDDTLDDSSTIRGQEKEEDKKEKQEKEQSKETKCPGKPKEVLTSVDDITSFVESQMASNPLPVNAKIVVKYIDTLRLYRKTGRISTNIIKNLWEKWKNYHPDVVSYSMWIHAEKHDDKSEEYTLGIMRKTKEHEARRGLLVLKNKSKRIEEEIQNDVLVPGNEPTSHDEYEKYYI
jgi:hypothetical protein